MVDAAKRLGEDDAAATRGAGRTLGEREEAARETAGRTATEEAASANIANQGGKNALE